MSKWAEECKHLVALLNHVHDEARRQAFLEAAEMAGVVQHEMNDDGSYACEIVAEHLREKAEE